jgi:hypothetical protein
VAYFFLFAFVLLLVLYKLATEIIVSVLQPTLLKNENNYYEITFLSVRLSVSRLTAFEKNSMVFIKYDMEVMSLKMTPTTYFLI